MSRRTLKETNREIREMIQNANLYQYQVAKACGCSEGTLTRWLRFELTEDTKQLTMDAIDQLKGKDTL